jgi:hypothetical protein
LTIFEYIVYYGVAPLNVLGAVVVLSLQFRRRKDTM